MIVTPEKGLFHCMACGEAGNVIQFVAKKEGIPEKEAALRLLDSLPGISRGSSITSNNKEKFEVDPPADDQGECKPELDSELFTAILKHYHQALFGRNKRGINYLKRRNLNEMEALQHFKVGFVDGTLTGSHRAVWNAQAATVYPDELICAESIFDALSIWMHGGKKNVIAAYGARGFTPHHTKLLRKSGTNKLVLAFDSDETGQERARELAAELTEKLNLACHRIKWPKHAKDGNDYFLYNAESDFKGSKESFASLLNAAPRIGFKKTDSSKLTLLEQTEEAVIFQNGVVNYKVRGGIGGVGNGGNMKVIVTATAAEKTHTDRLDL